MTRSRSARPLAGHLAFGVAGGSRDTEPHCRQIRLSRIEQRMRELRGLAEAYGEQSRSERIERAGMPGLLRGIQPFCALESGVRRQAQRLVQQQHAVHPAPRNADAGDAHQDCGLRSAATASSISCEMRMPLSIESS